MINIPPRDDKEKFLLLCIELVMKGWPVDDIESFAPEVLEEARAFVELEKMLTPNPMIFEEIRQYHKVYFDKVKKVLYGNYHSLEW